MIRSSLSRIIGRFHREKLIMEAERINAISHLLTDLSDREHALRGYL